MRGSILIWFAQRIVYARDVWSVAVGRLRFRWLCWVWRIRHGRRGLFDGPTIIRTNRAGQITVGNNVAFVSNIRRNMVGLSQPTILDVSRDGEISIGDDSGFSSVVMSSKSSIRVGSRVKVGGNVRIFDHDFHASDATVRNGPADAQNVRSAPVEIDDDVFIGANSVLLKGTHIGKHSIVAAGSVVFGLDIPPDSLVKGNPAIVVGGRS